MIKSFDFTAWLLLTTVLLYSPGPGNILCASSGSLSGIKKTLPLIAGLQPPAILYGILIGYGLTTYLMTNTYIIRLLIVCGSIYLFFLSYRLYKTSKGQARAQEKFSFRDGFIVSALNGKMIPVLVLIFSVSLTENSLFYAVTLVTMFTAMVGVTANLTWTFIGYFSNRIINNKASQKYFFSAMLAAVGIWLLHESFQY